MNYSLRPSPDALLNPCADPIFKSLFTQNSDESRQALTSFLSAVLGKTVSNVELQPNEMAVESSFDRQSVFDLTCIADGEPVNVEMQHRDIHDSFVNRSEYYAAHLLNHYVPKGGREPDIPRVYQISVVNFIINKDDDNPFSHYLMKKEDGKPLGERLNVIFLELPKMKKFSEDVQKLTISEIWGKFFWHGENLDLHDFGPKAAKVEPGIKCAMDVLQFLSKDEAQWQRQTSHEKWLFDVGMAKKEAREKGMKLGLEEGRAEGLAEGKLEGARETALKNAVTAVKEFNLDPQSIAVKFDVSLEELNKLL